MITALPVSPPLIVQVPVIVPAVVAFPVVIAVVVSVPVMFALAATTFPKLALALTVRKFVVTRFAVTLLDAVMLLADKFPVTVTAPNVVVPPDDVEVSDNQFDAEVVLAAGQTYNVLSFVLNQS
jgi:hypothetical protein